MLAFPLSRYYWPHLGVGLGVFMRAARAAAGLGVAACWARCTITADMDTVDTTADATIASIMALITCTESVVRLRGWNLAQAPDA